MTETDQEPRQRSSATITAVLPLALLEAMRVHDRPREVLEDENLSASLPRRLGLSDAVEGQIHRYERARRRGERVSEDEVRNLVGLVLRRPDGEEILREAGRLVARRHVESGPAAFGLVRKVLPRAVALVAARRTARRLLRRLVGTGTIVLDGAPLNARIEDGLVGGFEGGATACELFGGVLEELVFIYTGSRDRPEHDHRSRRGRHVCEWSFQG